MDVQRGIIYKITNKTNGYSYIGLTTKSLERRFNRHLQDAKSGSSYVFHRALMEYGEENFEKEVLENNIPRENLPEREIYWIAHYHTWIMDEQCKGYNMTRGGDFISDANRVLSDADIVEIRYLIKESNQKLTDIAKKFGVSLYAISDINTGKAWYDECINYPIRPYNFVEVTEEIFDNIVQMLKSGLFSQAYIANKFGVAQSVVSHINTGTYAKFVCDAEYPLSTERLLLSSTTNPENYYNAILDYLSKKFTRRELAEKYNTTLGQIKRWISSQKVGFSKGLKFPLLEHKDYNVRVIKEKISLFERLK